MKKIYFAVFSILTITKIDAQLTLTKAFNAPVSGNVDTRKDFDSTTTLNKSTGSGQVWNFSSVVSSTSGISIVTYTTAASVPGGLSNFPSANLASFSGAAPTATTDFSMIKSNANNEEYLGAVDNGTVNSNYSNTQLGLTYPFTFGTPYNDVSVATQGTGTNAITVTVTALGSGTGTGTVILPGGITLTNCLQVKITNTISLTASFGSLTGTNTTYSYYHASQKFSVIDVNYYSTTFLGSTTDDYGIFINNNSLPVGIFSNSLKNELVSIYPNPAKNIISIAGVNNYSLSQIQIVDALGRIVIEKNTNTSEIDISTLENGIYSVIISTPNGTLTKKFIKI
jgi:hypothetical protein